MASSFAQESLRRGRRRQESSSELSDHSEECIQEAFNVTEPVISDQSSWYVPDTGTAVFPRKTQPAPLCETWNSEPWMAARSLYCVTRVKPTRLSFRICEIEVRNVKASRKKFQSFFLS